MSFSTNLRYLRQKKGWSQDKLAEHLGYKSFTTIQKWESDKAEPNIRTLKKISDLFDVNMGDLLNENLKLADDQLKSMNEIKFKNANDAMKYIMNNSIMIDFCGYDINDIPATEQDIIINQITTYASFVLNDYKNKK